MTEDDLTPLVWMGRSRRDLKGMPVQVRREVGQALYWAQKGTRHSAAKPLRGELSGVMEIVSDHDRGTFRATYTTKLEGVLTLESSTASARRANRSNDDRTQA